MHQLGKDWWKELARRFVDRGECNRGAAMDGALEKRSCRLIVIRWKVGVAQQQACTGHSSPRPNGYAGIASSGRDAETGEQRWI